MDKKHEFIKTINDMFGFKLTPAERKLLDDRYLEHKGHRKSVTIYGDNDNITLECMQCYAVILDTDLIGWGDENLEQLNE